MSLHLFDPESRRTSSPASNNSTARYESSDSDNPSPSAEVSRLQEELKRERIESARAKKEAKELSARLLQVENERAEEERENKQKYDNEVKALHKGVCKINKLEKLLDEKEVEIAALKERLEVNSDRLRRSAQHLESSEKECSQLNLEKFQLLEKIAQLEKEVRELKLNAQTERGLMAELEQQRLTNSTLRRKLAAMIGNELGGLSDNSTEDESPERMLFDPYGFDQRADGVNLRQELALLGSPLTPTVTLSCQVPSKEDGLDGYFEEAAEADATTQTETVTVAECATQVEVIPAKSVSTQTRGVPKSTASAQTVRAPSEGFAGASTQIAASNVDCALANGMATALRPYHAPFSPYSEPTLVGSSNSRRFTWFWLSMLVCLLVAYIANGGRINLSSLVNLFKDGLSIQYNKGMPPH